ncbi:hypothetical protein [Roseococcus sp.]|uniref:hypothetical protein n=1 Tax=Roseococcus sp. TaxID=2109646 RepID=UPI003BABFE82
MGNITHASPLSLVLPISADGNAFLIGGTKEKPCAVFLNGEQDKFQFFEADEGYNWTGIIIPDVHIEVDPKSIGQNFGKAGSLLRKDADISINGRLPRGFGGVRRVLLMDGLPESDKDYSATFSNWVVVLGSGPSRRVLWEGSALT